MHQQHAVAKAIPAKGFLILLLGALTAVGPLSIDMYLPAFPELSRAMGVSISSVELSLSSFFIGLAIGQLFFGPLADFFGRKKPLQIGIAIYCLSSLALAFAPGIEALILLRFLQAIGGCSGMVISRAVVRDLFDHRDAAKIYSLLMLIMGVAPILAPTFGAYISVAFGWKGIFVLLFILSAVALAAVTAFLPETRARVQGTTFSLKETLKSYLDLLSDSSFMRFAIPNSLVSASMFAYVAGSPFVFIELFHLSPTLYGWVFGLNAFGIISASQLNRLLLRKFAPEKIVSRALFLTSISAFMLLAACVWIPENLILLMVPLFVMIASVGFVGPNTAALGLSKQGHRAGMASALYGSLQFTVAFLSSFLVSTFHADSAMPMASVIAACVLAATLVFFVLQSRDQEVSA